MPKIALQLDVRNRSAIRQRKIIAQQEGGGVDEEVDVILA